MGLGGKFSGAGAWIEKSVRLWITLVQPQDTIVHGTLDIDAVDGKPTNHEKNFTASSGKETSLGEWDLSLGEDRHRGAWPHDSTGM